MHSIEKLNKISNYLVLALITGTVLFFYGGPGCNFPRSIQYAWNFGHIIFYCILSVLIFNHTRFKKKSYYFQICFVFIITLFFGAAVEIIQSGFDRTMDVGDLFRNFTGSFLALLFLAPKRSELSLGKLKIYRIIIILLLISEVVPGIRLLCDEINAEKEFPLLSGFESKVELSRWEGNLTHKIDSDIKFSGNSSMMIKFKNCKFSGIFLKYFPENWSKYKTLAIKIYNPDQDFQKISCRIHDAQHIKNGQPYIDRYNDTFTLARGWNKIKIDLYIVANAPLNRVMDMGCIRSLGIFANLPEENKVIYLDDVMLVK